MYLIPSVNGKYEQGENRLILPKILTISLDFSTHTNLFITRLKDYSIDVKPSENPFIQLNFKDGMKEEQYLLSINQDNIKAEFSTEKGLYNALTTLFQLIISGDIRCCVIEDSPIYSHRGTHLDTARHYFSVNEIKRIIEQISLLKMNVLHWHFADDQGWRMEIKKYPMLTKACEGNFYTQEQAMEIVEYAKQRGVEIVPEFEIPGHSTALISAYPEISCRNAKLKLAQTGGIFKTIMCAGKDETYAMIGNIIHELCQIFTGKYFHIGGDEAPKKEWKKCHHCKRKLQQLGLTSFEQLQGHMLNYSADLLRKHDKIAICWNDCLRAENLDNSIIAQYWQHKSKAKLRSNRKIVLSRFMPLYFDYPYCVSNLKNVFALTVNIKSEHIMGIESALWTERIDTNEKLEYALFPRAVAVAQLAWGKTNTYDEFIICLNKYYHQFEKSNINAAPLKSAQIKGLSRAWELVKFSIIMGKALLQLILPQKVEY